MKIGAIPYWLGSLGSARAFDPRRADKDEQESMRQFRMTYCKDNKTAGGGHGELRPHCPYCGKSPKA